MSNNQLVFIMINWVFPNKKTQKFKCDLEEQWIRAQQYPLTNFPRLPQF